MKKTIIPLLAPFLFLPVLFSCSEDKGGGGSTDGAKISRLDLSSASYHPKRRDWFGA